MPEQHMMITYDEPDTLGKPVTPRLPIYRLFHNTVEINNTMVDNNISGGQQYSTRTTTI